MRPAGRASRAWRRIGVGVPLAAYGTGGLLLLGSPGSSIPGWFGWYMYEAFFLAVWLPYLAVAGTPRSPRWNWRSPLACGVGVALVHAVVALASHGDPLAAFWPQIILLAAISAVLGAARLLSACVRTAAAAQLVPSLLAVAALATPFWLNPLLEHDGLAGVRGRIIDVGLGVNALAAVAAAIDHDWLREGGLYERSVIGPFYPFQYPRPWLFASIAAVTALALGALGSAVAARCDGGPNGIEHPPPARPGAA